MYKKTISSYNAIFSSCYVFTISILIYFGCKKIYTSLFSFKFGWTLTQKSTSFPFAAVYLALLWKPSHQVLCHRIAQPVLGYMCVLSSVN